MNTTKINHIKFRQKLMEKLKDFAPETFADRFIKICLGLAIFGLFPIMTMFYPSAMFLASAMLTILVLIRVGEICVLAYGLQVMETMPTDIRKMQHTLLGYQSNLLAHVIAMTGFVWVLCVVGFPVFAALLGLLATAAIVLNCKLRKLCETEAV